MRRSTRQRPIKVWFDEAQTYAEPPPPKKSKKKHVESLEIHAAVDSAPSAIKVLASQPTAQFSLTIEVPQTPWIARYKEGDPLSLFMRFFGEISLYTIVMETNKRAEQECYGYIGPPQQYARPWHPIHRGEFLRWLGLLLYMANSI